MSGVSSQQSHRQPPVSNASHNTDEFSAALSQAERYATIQNLKEIGEHFFAYELDLLANVLLVIPSIYYASQSTGALASRDIKKIIGSFLSNYIFMPASGRKILSNISVEEDPTISERFAPHHDKILSIIESLYRSNEFQILSIEESNDIGISTEIEGTFIVTTGFLTHCLQEEIDFAIELKIESINTSIYDSNNYFLIARTCLNVALLFFSPFSIVLVELISFFARNYFKSTGEFTASQSILNDDNREFALSYFYKITAINSDNHLPELFSHQFRDPQLKELQLVLHERRALPILSIPEHIRALHHRA